MKFGISAALIAFAFLGVSKCDVTVPIECPNAEARNSCFAVLQRNFDFDVSTLFPFLKEGITQVVNVATGGTDCSAVEKGIRETSAGACAKCTIKTELCE